MDEAKPEYYSLVALPRAIIVIPRRICSSWATYSVQLFSMGHPSILEGGPCKTALSTPCYLANYPPTSDVEAVAVAAAAA